MLPKISILTNDKPPYHDSTINRLLRDAIRFDCAVAFAKWSGFSTIQKRLIERLKVGLTARFVIGLNFYQTDPSLLDRLLALSKSYKLEVFVSGHQSSVTFHPKLYLFTSKAGIAAIVGSANLTLGGLCDNYELSVSILTSTTNTNQALTSYIDTLCDYEDICPLTKPILDEYSKKWRAYRVLKEFSKQHIDESLKRPDVGLTALHEILTRMKADHSENGFRSQVKSRALSRKQSINILRRIASNPPTTRTSFLTRYDSLISCWHSGGLNRGKTRIAKNPNRFSSLLRHAADELGKTTPILFDTMRERALAIPGVGTNVMTEILHSHDNKRFAVMNQNSVHGMALAGFTNYPLHPTKQSVNGLIYQRYCRDANKVRQRFDLDNFSQLDAVFNYAYWAHREAEDDEALST